ncbi:MAG: family protein phosphatase [Gaiellales bacterium]|nr:family protein phosphatase [Gaiellales bacterium]
MSPLGVVDSAGMTQTGHVRRTNEDSYLMRGDLFMVADGVGGAAAGEVASSMCAEAFAEIDLIRLRGDAALKEAIRTANRRIYERAVSDPDASGMGTTVTAALVGEDGRTAFANVGDSRAYLLRGDELRRLSEDHSVVAELVASGQISPEEAERHPQRNVVTRALGADPNVEVDTFWLDGQEGDVLLLCSDGLHDMASETEIAEHLSAERPAEDVVRGLVQAALQGGGEDNITAIVFRLGERAPNAEPATRTILIQDPDLVRDDDEGGGISTGRLLMRLGIVFGVVAVLGVLGAVGLRKAHFVGADEASGHVAVYQGVPVELFAGVKLYHRVWDSKVAYASLTPATREELFDHQIRSESGAKRAVEVAAKQPL